MKRIYLDPTLRFTAKEMLQFKHSQVSLGEFIGKEDYNIFLDPDAPHIIFNICSRVTGAGMIKSLSRNRETDAVFARFMTMFFLKSIFDMELKKIGEVVGGRNHADVLHGIKMVNRIIDPTMPGCFRRNWFYLALGKIENRFSMKVKY